MSASTPSDKPIGLPHRAPVVPFIERPWLLLIAVALLIGIVGHIVWHSEGRGSNEVGAVIDSAITFYLGVGVLLVPGLSLRAARPAMRHLSASSRTQLLWRFAVLSFCGPGSIWLLSTVLEPFGGVQILRIAIGGSFVMSMGAIGGLLIRERYRR